MKIKWTVGAVPTGKYRSFQTRDWPSAEYPDGTHCASIVPTLPEDEDYDPKKVKTGNHGPLVLLIADHSKPEWTKVRAKARYASVNEAKAALVKLLEANPHLIPPHYREEQEST